MKKLKFLFILCLFGCGYNAIDNTSEVIITDIESSYAKNSKSGCYYYVSGNTIHRLYDGGYFFDKCGKYTVGDTIVISKK